MISIIAAMDRNRNIGLNGGMPWDNTMKADLARFKELTTGKIVVMGRKTFESIGHPLPNRHNVILSKNAAFACEVRGKKMLELDSAYAHTTVLPNLEEFFQLVKLSNEKEIFVIGGASIYEQFLPHVDRLYLTKVHAYLEGDTKFPTLTGNWEYKEGIAYPKDEENPYPYAFKMYERA